jgi:hypothetical protein
MNTVQDWLTWINQMRSCKDSGPQHWWDMIIQWVLITDSTGGPGP